MGTTAAVHQNLGSLLLLMHAATAHLRLSEVCSASGMSMLLQALAGVEITGVRDLDNGMDTTQAEGRSRLPWQMGDLMLTFTLDNVHTLTLRASGTEPKLKYYLEVCLLLQRLLQFKHSMRMVLI